VEASWKEQRDYLAQAVSALDGTPMSVEAKAALAEVEPQAPDLRGYLQVHELDEPIETANFSVLFDERGAIVGLQDRISGVRLASAQNPLGLFTYEVFSQGDYERYYRQYNQNKRQTWFSGRGPTLPSPAWMRQARQLIRNGIPPCAGSGTAMTNRETISCWNWPVRRRPFGPMAARAG
jgi:hypothetical protein